MRIIVTIIVIIALVLGLVFALRYLGVRRVVEQQTDWPIACTCVAQPKCGCSRHRSQLCRAVGGSGARSGRLRCGGVAAVWASLESVDDRTFRRLQLAAEEGGALGL